MTGCHSYSKFEWFIPRVVSFHPVTKEIHKIMEDFDMLEGPTMESTSRFLEACERHMKRYLADPDAVAAQPAAKRPRIE